MLVTDTCTESVGRSKLKDLRQRLDAAVLKRLKACGKLEPYSPEWDNAYHLASKPIFAICDEWRELLFAEYKKLWGQNASGSYFLPASALNREERMSVYRVTQKLALAA